MSAAKRYPGRACGQAIEEFRQEAGLSVASLAWLVGLSPWMMQRRLHNAGKLGLDELADIALALQVPVLTIVERAEAIHDEMLR